MRFSISLFPYVMLDIIVDATKRYGKLWKHKKNSWRARDCGVARGVPGCLDVKLSKKYFSKDTSSKRRFVKRLKHIII